jgi:hypothetical protein
MLGLNERRWSELEHTYGRAGDIPGLLKSLEDSPTTLVTEWSGAWKDLWEALCHGGSDVGTASYAATPHLLRIGQMALPQARWGYFCFIASIETSRLEGLGPEIPSDLQEAYVQTLRLTHDWTYALSDEPWEHYLVQCISAALAASKGHAALARVFLDLSRDNVEAFLRTSEAED